MPRDKTLSHERIIQAARDEFSEYGYDKASMRRIGNRCGLTAAALYRHFDSKEDMFDALVRPALEDLKEWFNEHVGRSEEAIRACTELTDSRATEAIWDSTEIDMMRELIYPRMEEYAMLINKSHGSRYENFLNDFVEYQQKRMIPQFKELKKLGLNVKDISQALMRRIDGDYRMIITLNSMLILLGAFGIITPATSAMMHNLSTIVISLYNMTDLIEA